MLTDQPMMHGVTGYKYSTSGPRGHHAYNVPAVLKSLPPGHLTILDAGCGSGFMTGRLAEAGHTVTGIDISEDGIAMAKIAHPMARFFVRSVFDDLSDIAPEKGFDVVVASEVIEHLYSPQQFLAGMLKNVRPGGHVVLTTPYYGYAKNLLISVTGRWDRHHMVENEGGHIKLFSKKSLSTMMRAAGLSDIRFIGCGRLPFLWKSMALSGRKTG